MSTPVAELRAAVNLDIIHGVTILNTVASRDNAKEIIISLQYFRAIFTILITASKVFTS
jgi:hypothetical protein